MCQAGGASRVSRVMPLALASRVTLMASAAPAAWRRSLYAPGTRRMRRRALVSRSCRSLSRRRNAYESMLCWSLTCSSQWILARTATISRTDWRSLAVRATSSSSVIAWQFVHSSARQRAVGARIRRVRTSPRHTRCRQTCWTPRLSPRCRERSDFHAVCGRRGRESAASRARSKSRTSKRAGGGSQRSAGEYRPGALTRTPRTLQRIWVKSRRCGGWRRVEGAPRRHGARDWAGAWPRGKGRSLVGRPGWRGSERDDRNRRSPRGGSVDKARSHDRSQRQPTLRHANANRTDDP
jgi:hypothetical protein